MSFFDIRSVWIVGASLEEWKIGNSLIKNLSFFEWEKYGVNPKWWSFEHIVFYKSISALPKTPDILVFAIPAKFVLTSLIEAWKKWVKRVIIISAWFKEIWNIEEENKIIEISKKYWIDLLWPNCLWYVDVIKNLNLSFWTKTLRACIWWECQNIAMVSQSGAMAVALTDWALSKKIGFSKLISMGNKAWVDENYLLKELAEDDDTKVISLYLESIEKWKEFYELTKKISKTKPIVLVKSWISDRWSKAATSHTWALSSKKEILETSFKNSWVHYTQSLEDFFLWSQIFSKVSIRNAPEELVIITNAWWPWVMATDHSENHWVKLTSFSDKEKNILKEWLPEAASVNNPIDIIWDATSKTYKQILNNLTKIDKKRAILVMLTAQSVTDVENIAEVIVSFKKENQDQFIMSSFMWWESVEKARIILEKNGILVYDYPKKSILAYSKVLKQKKWKKQKEEIQEKFILPKNLEKLKQKLTTEKKLCSNILTQEILESFEINTIKEVLVNTEDEVKKAYNELDTDLLVARISSADIAHKTDVWWVVLSIKTEEQAIHAYNKILKNISKNAPMAEIRWITFSKMWSNPKNKEIFLWFKRDKSFWNILIVWMWWIFVNVFEDVSRRIWIVTKYEIQKMFKELKIYPILIWTRWQKTINFLSLIDNIYKLQFLFNEFDGIKEIDINPIFSNEKESMIWDAKFYL